MRDEARLAGQNAVKFTYPRKKSDGTKAIDRDLSKLFAPMNGAGIEKTFEGGSVPLGHVAIKRTDGAVYAVPKDRHGNGVSERNIEKAHSASRSPRTGRVSGTSAAPLANVGRWKVSSKLHARKAVVNRYAKGPKSRVGQQKAGWLPALDHFARASKSAVRAPAWVLAQSKKVGWFVDTVTRGGNGSVELINRVPYWPDKKRIALENVVHGIARKRLDNPRTWRGLDKLAARFNDGRKVAA